jgi:acetylglutamate kinase
MKRLVIKVGGAFLDSALHADALFIAIKTLQQKYQVVLVHGGGNSVEQLLTQLGIQSEKIDGLRVTPEAHIGYIVGALAGTANKQLCALAHRNTVNNVGLSLADGNMTKCLPLDPQLGSVGKVVSKDNTLLMSLLEQHYLPIVSSIGCDNDGHLFNVNADQAATEVAQVLKADLLLLSDVDGVLDGNKSLICELDSNLCEQLIEENVIRDGMIIKVKAAQLAANSLQQPVTIASWKNPERLNALTNNSELLGTKVLPQVLQEQQ